MSLRDVRSAASGIDGLGDLIVTDLDQGTPIQTAHLKTNKNEETPAQYRF